MTPIYAEAVTAWCAGIVRELFAPLRHQCGMEPAAGPNPLAVGDFCDVCGTRVEGTRPCPLGPHDEAAA